MAKLASERFKASYLIETPLHPVDVAEVMAGEQSCGTFTRVKGETKALRARARAAVIATRARMAEGLARLGFDVLPSAANFVFARHPGRDGAGLASALRARGVIVRHFAAPRIADFLRITVGTEAQTDRLVAELSEILAEAGASG